MIGIVALLLVSPNVSDACPKCLASTDKPVLTAYYASFAMMSLLPVGIVSSVLGWIYFRNHRARWSVQRYGIDEEATPASIITKESQAVDAQK